MYFIFSFCYPPITEFCSAELLGYKFIVPCRTEEILSHNYGSENGWKNPVAQGFKFYNANWGNGETRSISELPYMYRYFYKNGTINLIKTLDAINQHYYPLAGKNLTRLPTNDVEFI